VTRKNLIGVLVGAVILTASTWGLLFWVSTPLNLALWFLDALLGLYLLSKTTANLLAARLPPPPPRAVLEPPSLWEDDDEEETP
jgi:hypothetical protein